MPSNPKQKKVMESMTMKPAMRDIDEKMLPQIKGWKVGQSYGIKVTAKMTGLNEYDDKLTATFEIEKMLEA